MRGIRLNIQLPFKSIKFPSPRWPSGRVGRTLSHWWLEFLSCILVIIAFASLVTVLHAYQDQPLPQWPLGLSINTALSVFAIVFKGPALFIAAEGLGQLKWRWFARRRRPLSDLSIYDDAARGPWGATRMLCTIRRRHVTASLGALITIGAIGVDPFTQAVVSYYGCNIGVNNASATVQRVIMLYDGGDDIKLGDKMSPEMRMKLVEGYFDAGAIEAAYTCASGNCTLLDPYHTIGVCTTCTDLTAKLNSSFCLNNPKAGYGPEYNCNHTLSGQTTAGIVNYSTSCEEGAQWDWQVLSVNKLPRPIDNNDGSIGQYDPSQRITTIDVVSALPIMGVRCEMNFCMRTYTATIDSGKLKETLQSTASNWSAKFMLGDMQISGHIAHTARVDCLTHQTQTHLLANHYISQETERMAWNGTYLNGTEADSGISNATRPAIPSKCSYKLRLHNLDEVLTSSILGNVQAPQVHDMAMNVNFITTPVLSRLFNNGSISYDSVRATFNNLSTVATNWLRQSGSLVPSDTAENAPALGVVLTHTTCTHVRWQWLSLPAALTVATLVYTGALVAQTVNVQSQGVWKSSQNALLWHGPEGPAEDESASLVTSKELDERAKQVVVQLGRSRKGWKLIQHGS